MPFKKVDPKQSFPKMEEEVLKFWEEDRVFEKSVSQRAGAPLYSFYDGPPFATGLPHYGHIVASTIKDVVPRYWTMRGYQVPRKWGWDCHGLPIENIAEKGLGIKKKKEIEELGVEKFNEFCRSTVLEYVSEWKKIIRRLGRWADMENSYKTMDRDFMESVWWVFKELWDKGLIYEGYRSMHICTRCETTLSQQEVSEGYKDIKDLSAIAKFELIDEPGTYVLAWTTTPWTLIGNVALAINKDITYLKFEVKKGEHAGESYIFAQGKMADLLSKGGILIAGGNFEELGVISKIEGADLTGKRYKPLFDYYQNKGLKNEENGWKIYAGDFVTTEDGTGVVHIAPAFGEDDLKLGYANKLPFIQHVGMDGLIKKEAGEFAGLSVKPLDDHMSTDVEIIRYLAKNGLLFSKEKYEHSYPHCWRCDTPLINYATSSWFVAVTKIKERMLELAKEINWSPEHMKEGRFGNWLEGARDWSISRQRYWASVMPIWKCACGEARVFGSVKDLEEASGQKVEDLHKHVVDKITMPCPKCGGTMRRIPDVLDTWFDSGSMPYAQAHYPFENKEKFEKSFPAQFIAEGVDQTRAWFYYLHVIATGIRDSEAFKNVIVNGIVLAEDGKKMSKRLKNYPDPVEVIDKYGSDALRLYLMSSPVVAAENLNFKESDVADLVRGAFRMLWNSYSFFALYADIDGFDPEKTELNPKHLLDRWIMSEFNSLIVETNRNMEAYELHKAARLFPRFIDNLSNWYIRRSRKRFWKSENDDDKNQAYATLYHVLVELSKLMAPFTPFIAEEVYKNLTQGESVHLEDFPKADEKAIDESLNFKMDKLRKIVTSALSLRAKVKIKVRQPLGELVICTNEDVYQEGFDEIIREEINVKSISFDGDKLKWPEIMKASDSVVYSDDRRFAFDVFDTNDLIGLDINITEDLKLEGQAREIIRAIQEMRKEADYVVDDRIEVGCVSNSPVFGSPELKALIMKETLANSLEAKEIEGADLRKDLTIDGGKINVSIKRA